MSDEEPGECSQHIELDHLTTCGSFPPLLVNASQNLRVTHSAFRGNATPWTGRAHIKYRGTASYQIALHSEQPGNEHLESPTASSPTTTTSPSCATRRTSSSTTALWTTSTTTGRSAARSCGATQFSSTRRRPIPGNQSRPSGLTHFARPIRMHPTSARCCSASCRGAWAWTDGYRCLAGRGRSGETAPCPGARRPVG